MNNLINRSNLFDDIFRDLTTGFYVKPLHGDELPRSIKVDINENDDSYTVQAEMPGIAKDDIHINIEGAVVTIRAEVKQQDSKVEKDKVLRNERYFGTVSRSFELPQSVNSEKANAKYDDGVLNITLPKLHKKDGQHRLHVK